MADDHGAAVTERLHDGGDIAREVVKRDVLERSGAAADAARLWTQHEKAAGGETVGHGVVVFGIARQRGQQHDRRTATLDDGLDDDVAVADLGTPSLGGSGAGHEAISHQECNDDRCAGEQTHNARQCRSIL